MLPPCRFSLVELFRAAHDYELTCRGRLQDDAIHVHLDHRHMGVGGDDSWSPSVHAEFLVPPKRYAFELVLAPKRPGRSMASLWKGCGRG